MLDAQICLSNNLTLIASVIDFTYQWGLNHGLTSQGAAQLSFALDELVTDIMHHAFSGESQEKTFDIFFYHQVSTLEIRVLELGEPFEPDNHIYHPPIKGHPHQFKGAGLLIIREMVDHFIFLNHGKKGKEFRLFKYVQADHIKNNTKPEQMLEPEKSSHTDVVGVEPKDAEDLARLIYRTWGYTYPKEEMYYPKKIQRVLEKNKKFAVISRTEKGKAVGYFAVIKMDDSPIGEVAEAVVSPSFRGQGIMTKMMSALIERAKEQKLDGLFAEAITIHAASQKVNARFHFVSTALLLHHFPSLQSRGFEKHEQFRISVLIEYLPLCAPLQRGVYLPEKYKTLLRTIYAALKIQLIPPPTESPKMPKHSLIDLELNYRFRHALLITHSYGHDFSIQTQNKIQELVEKEYQVIHIDLPLNSRYIQTAVHILSQWGFVFSGLMPSFHQGQDFLRLQKVANPVNFKAIIAKSDLAKEIKGLIKEELKSWNSH